tara:strand:- start:60 stop:320 length:261 start_codon:yes stop_codon:yes gene_type:complete
MTSVKPVKFYIMKNTITETTRLLLQGNLTKEEADKILLGLHSVSDIFPPLNTVKQEINKYKETTQQGDKGHFQNGINWAFNYIAKK